MRYSTERFIGCDELPKSYAAMPYSSYSTSGSTVQKLLLLPITIRSISFFFSA